MILLKWCVCVPIMLHVPNSACHASMLCACTCLTQPHVILLTHQIGSKCPVLKAFRMSLTNQVGASQCFSETTRSSLRTLYTLIITSSNNLHFIHMRLRHRPRFTEVKSIIVCQPHHGCLWFCGCVFVGLTSFPYVRSALFKSQ